MEPITIAVASAAALAALYELSKSPVKKAPATPTKPPAPPVHPVIPGVVTPPPAFPGLVGWSVAQIDDLPAGTLVTGWWANDATGAKPITGDSASDQAITDAQALVHGVVQPGSTASRVIVQISAVDPGNFPTPANLTPGSTIVGPTSVWYPPLGKPGGGSDMPLQVGGTATVNTASTGSVGALNIRANPSTSAQILGHAAHGDTVSINALTNANWSKVTTAANVTGYASNAFLEGN